MFEAKSGLHHFRGPPIHWYISDLFQGPLTCLKVIYLSILRSGGIEKLPLNLSTIFYRLVTVGRHAHSLYDPWASNVPPCISSLLYERTVYYTLYQNLFAALLKAGP